LGGLWREVQAERDFADDIINVRCVDEDEIKRLNREHRGVEKATNVLTFSYSGEHDVAICVAVAEREAVEREQKLKDYVALLLVHAMLHATGLDHEGSGDAADEMASNEQTILKRGGYLATSL